MTKRKLTKSQRKRRAKRNPLRRLEYIRGKINAECISYGEIAELQALVDHIDKDDVQLLQWAGVPEFPCEHGNETDSCSLCEGGQGDNTTATTI